jgi:transposase
MEQYVGLDVSLKLTAICIVDRTGKIVREGVVASDPETIATFIKSHAPHVARVGLETGATSTWLWTELNKMDLPVICIDARHAKAALKLQINKSDRNDAVGIARIMQCGWYKEVRVKDLDSHAIKALLVSRALLVKIKRDIENQVRGLLKNLGLVTGQAKMNVFSVRAAELAGARPELAAAVEPLLKAREAIGRQIADLDRKVMRLARNDAHVRRFMTAPGVGPITALCFLATIDDPTRFKRSRSVGAYVGLTTRRYASGEIDRTGRISKCGDKMLRSYLYEVANVLLTRVAKWSALKAWGVRLAKRSGLSQGCRGSKACSHSASHVDRRHRIQLVIKGGCQSTCIAGQPESRRSAGTNVPAETLALVRPPLPLRCSREQNALHTLIHQRHLPPSC